MLNSTSFVFVVKKIGQEPTSVITVSNYWAISWLIRQILVENTRQDWLGQEQTSVLTVSNYWAISLLTRHSLDEHIRQNWLGQESTSVITVSNYLYNNIVLSMLYAEICPKVRRHNARPKGECTIPSNLGSYFGL